MGNRKTKIISVVSIIALALTLVTATYAYFAAQTGEGAQTDIKINASTVDTLTFETGSIISLSLDQDNFASGKGNQSGTTFAKAMLSANNKTNTVTEHYNLYLSVDKNTFNYTQDTNTPEILLTIKDDSGNEITSINNLTYKTVTDASGATIKGFDITTGIGIITLLNNREITANPQKTDTWNVTVTFINYDKDQSKNAGKSFNAKLMIQKEMVLKDYIIAQYTGTQGINHIYHHDSNLSNGAGDNSYRYAGEKHPDYYSCQYNGFKVVNSNFQKNESLKGDCSSVNKVTVFGFDIYIDKTLNKIKDTVSWDNVNNKCLTSSGEEVTQSIGNINETTCTGYAYFIAGDWTIGITVEEVGAGEEILYSPAEEGVNNFVCFGSSESPCPTDSLYRIIGVIDGKVKLIKYDYATKTLLGTDGDYGGAITPDSTYKGSLPSIDTYYWNNATKTNKWSESNLNKINLNKNYIKNIGDKWANKIATTTWKVGGVRELTTPLQLYQNEIVTPAENTTYDAKIGMMYASDYGFASDKSKWTEDISNYDTPGIVDLNWIPIGYSEKTISRQSDSESGVFIVDYTGYVWNSVANDCNGVRPVFNLMPTVTYVSGSGTQSDPIRIN